MKEYIEAIKEMHDMLKEKEWETHHCAENTYCPYCIDENSEEYWQDQKEHHENCKYVELMKKAESILSKFKE